MKDFRELIVWKKAHTMVLEVYLSTTTYPNHEQFGLISQTRRAASSIPTNIAEGCGRGSDADFKRFLQISFASANELDYLLILALDLGYIINEKYRALQELLVEVKKMLAVFINKLKLTANS